MCDNKHSTATIKLSHELVVNRNNSEYNRVQANWKC